MIRPIKSDTPSLRVTCAKVLGVLSHQFLTLNDHIQNVSAKIAKHVGILYWVAYLLQSCMHTDFYYGSPCFTC